MFGEEVNHSKGHCFLSFQIPRPSNLVCWPLIRALVQSSKDSTKPHIRLLSSSNLTNKNWSSTWPPQPVDGRRFSHPLVPFWIGEVKARCRWCTKASPEGSPVWFPFENYRLAKRTIKYNSGLRSFEQRLHLLNGCWWETESYHCIVQEPSVDTIVYSRKIKTELSKGLEAVSLSVILFWSRIYIAQRGAQTHYPEIKSLMI